MKLIYVVFLLTFPAFNSSKPIDDRQVLINLLKKLSQDQDHAAICKIYNDLYSMKNQQNDNNQAFDQAMNLVKDEMDKIDNFKCEMIKIEHENGATKIIEVS